MENRRIEDVPPSGEPYSPRAPGEDWADSGEPRQRTRHGDRPRDMHSLRQQAIDLVAQDITTASEVIRSIYAL